MRITLILYDHHLMSYIFCSRALAALKLRLLNNLNWFQYQTKTYHNKLNSKHKWIFQSFHAHTLLAKFNLAWLRDFLYLSAPHLHQIYVDHKISIVKRYARSMNMFFGGWRPFLHVLCPAECWINFLFAKSWYYFPINFERSLWVSS